jgi:hypothetical protein
MPSSIQGRTDGERVAAVECHLLPISNEDVAWRMERSGNGDDLEAASKKWVGRIRDPDYGQFF